MAVSLDANATAANFDVSGTAVTLDNAGLTVGSGANRVLIAQISFFTLGTLPTGLTIVWDPAGANQSLTQIVSTDNGSARSALWGLVNPVAGNKILRASWANANLVEMNCTSFLGVLQTGGTATFANSNSATGSSTTINVVITSTSGNGAISTFNSSHTPSAPNQTSLYLDSANVVSGAAYALSAGNVSFSWTQTPTGAWTAIGCDIVAFPTPIFPPPPLINVYNDNRLRM